MTAHTKIIRVEPDTMKRFQEYIGPYETANTVLSNMIDLIDQLAEDMGV